MGPDQYKEMLMIPTFDLCPYVSNHSNPSGEIGGYNIFRLIAPHGNLASQALALKNALAGYRRPHNRLKGRHDDGRLTVTVTPRV